MPERPDELGPAERIDRTGLVAPEASRWDGAVPDGALQGLQPRMLLTLLLYGYCRGVYSSRKIAVGCESDVAFRVLSGDQFPDFRTVSDFRKNHLEAFQGLFIPAVLIP